MILNSRPSHVAILVRSVQKAAEYLRPFGFLIGPEEVWEGEGTKEIYVEREKANSLLLMEPIKPGAYQRALDKRGPGLHHLAIDVLNLEEDIASLARSGWLLHPTSLKTIAQSRTAYLARPGFPALIEVQEREKLSDQKLFVERLSIQTELSAGKLLQAIGLESMVATSTSPTELVLSGQRIMLHDLIA